MVVNYKLVLKKCSLCVTQEKINVIFASAVEPEGVTALILKGMIPPLLIKKSF